jgi:hypothetical protein
MHSHGCGIVCPRDSMPADSACVPSISSVNGTTLSPPHADFLDSPSLGPVPVDLHLDEPPPPEPPPAPTDYPSGSIIHHLIQDQVQPPSPSNPFDFPLSLRSSAIKQCSFAELPTPPSVFDSVVWVFGCAQVLGLHLDSQSTIQICKSDTSLLLIDEGTNICITGDLSTLVRVANIPPLAITVTIKDSKTSVNDCCMKQGLLPLTILDGSIHWQVCFFCASAAETIISPQAVLASSNIFISWLMTGYKDGQPRSLRFNSHDGFLHMLLALVCHNRLYYFPADVFTVDHLPIRVNSAWVPTNATILHVTNDRPQPVV